MSALIDISPAFGIVKVQNQDINAYGLTAAQIAKLLIRFPGIRHIVSDIRDLIVNAEGDIDFEAAASQIDHAALAKLGSAVIGAIIAYSTRDDDNEKVEAVASQLPAGIQLAFLKNAYGLTFPNGLGEAMATIGLAEEDAE